jgi:hypothetical protein
MNCNCKTEIEAKLLESFKSEAPDGVDHSVSMHGYGFCIVGNKMIMRPYTEVTRAAQMPRKAGGFTSKRTKLNMFFSYCPFCGTPVVSEPEAVRAGSTVVAEGGAA